MIKTPSDKSVSGMQLTLAAIENASPRDKRDIKRIGLDKALQKRASERNVDANNVRDHLSMLHRDATQLLRYVYDRVDNFPRHRKDSVGIGSDIIVLANKIVRIAIAVESFNPYNNREQLLREQIVDIKLMNDLVDICYCRKYISKRNRGAWTTLTGTLEVQSVMMAKWYQKANSVSTKKDRARDDKIDT